jgi:hypothetical protein
MNILDYEQTRIKKTPYGRIKIYTDGIWECVLTSDVFELAEVYAKKHNWTEAEIKTIGGTYPF